MFLSDIQMELKEKLETFKRQVELLDSHKLTGLINDKQYKESMYRIAKQLDVLEEQFGLEPYDYNSSDVEYDKRIESKEKIIRRRTGAE